MDKSFRRNEALSTRLATLQEAFDAESLWTSFADLLQTVFGPVNDILFASPMLGFHPVFARTVSNYPRGEGYWARLVEIAGVTDVMTHFPGLPAARMSDHFDRSRERDELMYREFMEPEGWAHCANLFFWNAEGKPLGTLAMNRTAEQGDFSDEEMALTHWLQPHLQAALNRVIRQCRQDVAFTALRQSLNTFPVPILTLDKQLQLTFINPAGRASLHRWRMGGLQASRRWQPEMEMPEDLADTCRQLLATWTERIQADTYQGEKIAAEQEHPTEPGFQATLQIVHPPNESTEPGLILSFQNPADENHATAQALQLLGSLTQAEREVARLAANGHQNEDIATELGISNHTVRAHLRKVFAKLGINSRSHLAPLFHKLK